MGDYKFFILKKKINIKFYKYNIILSNQFDNNNNIVIKNKILIIDLFNNNLFINRNQNFKSFLEILKPNLKSFGRFFFIHLTLIGLGFRIRKYIKENISFLKIELGYSHFIYYPLPELVYFEKGKKSILLYSLDYNIVNRIVNQLVILRKITPYKEKGLFITNKSRKKKNGKQDQR